MADASRKMPDCETLYEADSAVVRHAAQNMIDRFAHDARLVAVDRAGKAFERGDMDCVELWLRIAREVQELERIGAECCGCCDRSETGGDKN